MEKMEIIRNIGKIVFRIIWKTGNIGIIGIIFQFQLGNIGKTWWIIGNIRKIIGNIGNIRLLNIGNIEIRNNIGK